MPSLRPLILFVLPALMAVASPPLAAQPVTEPAAPAALASAATSPEPGARCEAGVRSLSERAFDLTRRTLEHNRFAVDHAQKYQREVAVCEASKNRSRPELEACVALLDKAQARAEKGNQVARVLAKDTDALRLDASRHNQSCPLHQIHVMRQ